MYMPKIFSGTFDFNQPTTCHRLDFPRQSNETPVSIEQKENVIKREKQNIQILFI